MSSSRGTVIKIYNLNGTFHSVCLYEPVRAEEVIQAIGRRQGIDPEDLSKFGLCMITLRNLDEALKEQQGFAMYRLKSQEKPLAVKSKAEKNDSVPDGHNQEVIFFFCDEFGEKRISEEGVGHFLSLALAETSSGKSKGEDSRHRFLTATTKLQNGELYGYLLKRSKSNDREWQRRWTVLRRDGLYHCKSRDDQSDIQHIPLIHNIVRTKDSLRSGNCFELHTAHSIEYFRAKTAEECQDWVNALRRNIRLASENEYLMLAEYIISDEEKAKASKKKETLLAVMESLEGLLSMKQGYKILLQFARTQDSVKGVTNDITLLLIYRDIQRAKKELMQESSSPRSFQEALPCIASSSTYSIGSSCIPGQRENLSEIIQRLKDLIPQKVGELNDILTKRKEALQEVEIALLAISDITSIILEELKHGVYLRFCQSDDYSNMIASLVVNR